MCSLNEDDPPVHVEKIEDSCVDVFLRQTMSYRTGYYRVLPYNMVFPEGYLKFDERIRSFQIHDDDVWVATAIKSGTCVYLVYCKS